MSYVLQLWSHPVEWRYPGTLDEVLAMLAVLDRRRVEEPRFRELARRLTARHPCISAPESDELDESELAWSDGPLDGRCDTAVYGIGLASGRLDEVLPFVRDTARELGLSVYDDQDGKAHLANGLILDVHRGEVARVFRMPALGHDLPDKDQLLDRVEATLGPRLTALGFALRRRDPRGRTDYGYAEAEWLQITPIGEVRLLIIALDKRPGAVCLKLYVEVVAEPVSRFRLEVLHGGTVPAEAKPLTTLGFWTRRWMNDPAGMTGGTSGELVMNDLDELARGLKQLDTQIGERLTPLLPSFHSLSGLAAFLYPGRLQFAPSFQSLPTAVDALVAAHLGDAPWTAALITELEAQAAPDDRRDKLAAAYLSAREQAFHAHTLACIERIRSAPRPKTGPKPPLRWGRR